MRAIAVPTLIGLMLLSAEARSQEDDPLPVEDVDAGPPEAAEDPTSQPEELAPPALPEPEPEPEPAAASPEVEQAGPEKPDLQLELEGGWLSRERYVAGGITGSVLSFGIGHMIVGEWTNFGWVYTATQLLGAGLLIAGPIIYADSCDGTDDENCGGALMIPGAAILGLSYIFEKIDLWYRPVDRIEPPPAEQPGSDRFIGDQPDQPEITEQERHRRSKARLAEVERATDREMDDDFEDYLESDDVATETFAAYVHGRYHKQRVWGIVMASAFTPVLLAASGGFAVASAFGGDELFGALSIGTGALGLASLGFGIWLAVRGLRVCDAVEPLLDESTEEASVRLRLTMVTDAHGIPSGGGLSLTF